MTILAPWVAQNELTKNPSCRCRSAVVNLSANGACFIGKSGRWAGRRIPLSSSANPARDNSPLAMAFARTYKRRVSMKAYRLNRLFNAKSGRCFDVAVDHGFFNEGSFLQGIENLDTAVQTLVEADPDAIQLTVGQARLLQQIPGKQKPALVLRTDVANVYGTDLPDHLFSRVIEDAAEQAVRLDAACVVVNLFRIPGAPEVTDLAEQVLKLISD